MIFECEVVEERNADGQLDEIGVRWTEAKATAEMIVRKCGMGLGGGGSGLFIIGLFTLIAGLRISGVLLLAGIAAFVLGCVVCFMGVRMKGRTRWIVFSSDGVALTPWGLSGKWRSDRLAQEHGEIENIGWEQLIQPKGEDPTPYTHGVRIVYKDGAIERVAKNLEPDNALMLSVRLSKARAKLQDELGGYGVSGAVTSGRRQRQAGNRYID